MKTRMRDWPIDDLNLLALCKLQSDDTITTYIMIDGVEYRTQANPMAKLAKSMEGIVKAFERMGQQLTNMAQALGQYVR